MRIIKALVILKPAHSHNDSMDSTIAVIKENYHDFKKKNL